MNVDAGAVLATPRTRRRWTDAVTLLRNFALVTFDVDPARLARALPDGLRPEVRTLDDGRQRGFVSAVSFRDIDFRFRGAELVRASFGQTNYRAYVIGPDGRRAVHFFETTLDSRLAVVPRRLWGMPWFGGRTTIEAAWDGPRCLAYRHVCTGDRNGVDAQFTGTDVPAGRLDGFADADDTAIVLTHPLDGFYQLPDGRLGRYSVWHPRLRLTVGSAVRSRYAVFERLGLVAAGATPHSVLLQPSVEFDVHLPPVRGAAANGRRTTRG
ncbi:MAG TPA: DUF2071 domain-containing protein [Candidatus Dormibacteraeota bacterium]|nr:DUF2071 domain-containing protein [Candidatus Dormibacteraeota bacterium]